MVGPGTVCLSILKERWHVISGDDDFAAVISAMEGPGAENDNSIRMLCGTPRIEVTRLSHSGLYIDEANNPNT